MGSYAFIDGQNLYLGITKADDSWKISHDRFFIYLKEKYDVIKAYYFIGYFDSRHQDLYNKIEEAGFIIVFREHSSEMLSHKKGNVDTEIVFFVMRELYNNTGMDTAVLVSGDGDYWRMVEFLVSEGRFSKILFPSRKNASSLYKRIPHKYRGNLDDPGVKRKIELK